MTKRVVAAAAALCALSGSAMAGTQTGSFWAPSFFGASYGVNIFSVGTDLSSQGLSPAAGRLEPEGMVFANGNLYVTGDGSTAEANGYVAVYAGGNLSTQPTAVRFTATSGVNTAAYGPEGITVNTRGVGIGSGASTFVGIDSVVSPVSQRILATMPITGGTVGNASVGSALNYDDITFVPGAASDGSQDRFAVLNSVGVSASAPTGVKLSYLSAADASVTSIGVDIPDQSKGLVFIPAADASLFKAGVNQDVLLVGVGPGFVGDPNSIQMYGLDGTLLDTVILGVAGTGANVLPDIEALAWDSATKRLFIGAEASGSSNGRIAVVVIPAPGAASLLAGAGLLAARRRR